MLSRMQMESMLQRSKVHRSCVYTKVCHFQGSIVQNFIVCLIHWPILAIHDGNVVLFSGLLNAFLFSLFFIFPLYWFFLVLHICCFRWLFSITFTFLADIVELNLLKTTKITFKNGKDDLMNFESTIKPDEGYYM
jgi:hypothetical protein